MLAAFMVVVSRRRHTSRRRGDPQPPEPSQDMSQTASDTSRPLPAEEARWIELAAAGDMVAFRRLYDRYVDDVSRHVTRLLGPKADVEDVVQEVFVQVFRSLGSYRQESAFSTWLYRITRNVTVSHLRRRPNTVDLAAWRPLRASASDWSKLEAREQVRVLYAAMEKFSVENREAFILHEIEGLKLREIEELTGESLNTIASRVRRTREQLRDILEATYREDAHA